MPSSAGKPTRLSLMVIAILLLVGIIFMLAVILGVLYVRLQQPKPTVTAAMPSPTTTQPSDTPPPVTKAPSPEPDVLVPDTTRVLSGTTLQHLDAVSRDSSLYTFSETTPELETLAAGDIIVGDISPVAPDGFLRRVVDVRNKDGAVEVQTTPARIEEAIERGSLSVSRELAPGDVRGGWGKPGVGLASLSPMLASEPWLVTLDDVVLLDVDGDTSTVGDQVIANGSLSFQPNLDFDLAIAWFQIERLELVAGATETVDLQVRGNTQLLDVHEQVEIACFPLQPFTVFVGPVPVVLSPSLHILVGLDGTAQVGFEAGVTQHASLSAGLRYNHNRWSPVGEFTNDFYITPPTVTGSLQVRAYGGLQIEVLIYGVVGPYAHLDGRFDLDVDIQRQPPWRLYGGLQCKIGVRFQILGYRIRDYELIVLDTRRMIGEGSLHTEADTPRPTPTKTATPSSTPRIPTFTPSLTPYMDATSTPSPTPHATATYTPSPTLTPSPTPTSSPTPCAINIQGPFAALYQAHRDSLLCPLTAEPVAIQDAEQAFENGHMFWRADRREIFVIYERGSRAGTYQLFVDTWVESDPVYSCAATPPADLVQPWRGFGRIWCNLGADEADIGWGLETEQGFGPGQGDPLVQDFVGGVIVRDSQGTASGQVTIFFYDSADFSRTSY